MKEVELSTSVTNRKKKFVSFFFSPLLSLFSFCTHTFFCHSFQNIKKKRKRGKSSRLNLHYQIFLCVVQRITNSQRR